MLFSCFASINATYVDVWKAGVSRGDFFYYEMYGVFTSSDPTMTIEVPAFEQNNTDWVKIDIINVSGSTVHQLYTLQFKNRTETFGLVTDLDPSNADKLSFHELGVPICAANVKVGDSLPTVPLTIQETEHRSYSNGNRETNVASWNTSTDWGRCYFDKKTGMLVDLYHVHSYVNQNSGVTVYKADIVKMTYSSLWKIGNQSIPEIVS